MRAVHPNLIPQLTRILGADAAGPLGLAPGAEPTPSQLQQLRRLIGRRIEQFAAALLAEAAANDDVTDAASAFAYLEDRLAFFADVLTPDLAVAIRAAFVRGAERWA